MNFCDESIEASSGPVFAREFFKKAAWALLFSTRNAFITTQSSREILPIKTYWCILNIVILTKKQVAIPQKYYTILYMLTNKQN